MKFSMKARMQEGRQTVLSLIGSLDVSNAAGVRGELERLRHSPSGEGLVLDLAGLHVLDSISLGIIIQGYVFFSEQRRSFVIRDPSPEVSELLQISCLDQLIPIEYSES